MQARIYHNPRCSKSRQALEMLEKKGLDLDVRDYLKEGLTEDEILDLSQALNMPVIDFVRKKEDEFKKYDIDWNDNHAAAVAIVKSPRLLERPIVVTENKAIIARPPELLEELF